MSFIYENHRSSSPVTSLLSASSSKSHHKKSFLHNVFLSFYFFFLCGWFNKRFVGILFHHHLSILSIKANNCSYVHPNHISFTSSEIEAIVHKHTKKERINKSYLQQQEHPTKQVVLLFSNFIFVFSLRENAKCMWCCCLFPCFQFLFWLLIKLGRWKKETDIKRRWH